MQALIENLVKLQSIDLDRARLNQELRALPAEIAQSHTRLAAAERQSAEASAALSREDTLRTRLDREIAGHRQKAAKFRTQLDSVTNTEQASAIEHEISFETAEAERLENEEYTSLERTEAQEAALAQSRAQVELLAAELEGVRARVAARQQELLAELASFDTARAVLRSALDADWLARFDHIVASRGTLIRRWRPQPKRRSPKCPPAAAAPRANPARPARRPAYDSRPHCACLPAAERRRLGGAGKAARLPLVRLSSRLRSRDQAPSQDHSARGCQ